MSGSAAKASARDIRRAFGHQAVDTVEQVKLGLRAHSVTLIEHKHELHEHAQALSELERKFLARMAEHEAAFTAQKNFTTKALAQVAAILNPAWRQRMRRIFSR